MLLKLPSGGGHADGLQSTQQKIKPESTSRHSTASPYDIGLRAPNTKDAHNAAPPQYSTQSSISSNPILPTKVQSKLPSELAPSLPKTVLRHKPPDPASIKRPPTSLQLKNQHFPQSHGSAYYETPILSLPYHSQLPPIFRRYLADLQDPLETATAENQQNFINQQATRDQQRLIRGLEPQSYQAKGKIVCIYDCSDGLGWKMGAAIEVIHAPLGFPNQEVWLWEVRTDFRHDGLREGSVVLFRIVWEMRDNHWEVVDVRG